MDTAHKEDGHGSRKKAYEGILIETFLDKHEEIRSSMEDVNKFLIDLGSAYRYTYNDFCRDLISNGKDLMDEVDPTAVTIYEYLNFVLIRMVRSRLEPNILEKTKEEAKKTALSKIIQILLTSPKDDENLPSRN